MTVYVPHKLSMPLLCFFLAMKWLYFKHKNQTFFPEVTSRPLRKRCSGAPPAPLQPQCSRQDNGLQTQPGHFFCHRWTSLPTNSLHQTIANFIIDSVWNSDCTNFSCFLPKFSGARKSPYPNIRLVENLDLYRWIKVCNWCGPTGLTYLLTSWPS